MDRIVHVLFGDFPTVLDAVIKTSALFVTAALLFRFTERRTLAEFAPFDWIAAVAAGAIVGRAATASDTSWLAATAALLCLLPPLHVLIRDGQVDRRALRRCGLTVTDLDAVLRQHGHPDAARVHLAILEAKGAISVLGAETATSCPARVDGSLPAAAQPDSSPQEHQ